MRILIYILEDHLENLNKFLNDEQSEIKYIDYLEYTNSKPILGKANNYIEVSLKYEDYIRLKDLENKYFF